MSSKDRIEYISPLSEISFHLWMHISETNVHQNSTYRKTDEIQPFHLVRKTRIVKGQLDEHNKAVIGEQNKQMHNTLKALADTLASSPAQ